jgi:hypothetical protein
MLDLLIALVPLSLAAWRIWRIVAVDDITEPIRARVMWRGGAVWGRFMDGLMCAWCLGFWISGAVVAAYVFGVGLSPWLFPVGWCAVSAGVGITNVIVDNLSSNE